jgi:hypothetical protein
MTSKKNLRKQFFVDPKVQGALVWRSILYACTCIGAMVMILLCWRIVTGPARMFYHHFDDMWFFYGPALIVLVLMLPLIILDVVRMSNRFTGPMLRLRRSMRALARGEHVEPLRFRDKDFWHDFAEDFNAVVARVQGETTGQGVGVAAGESGCDTTACGSGDVQPVAQSESAADSQSTATTSHKDEEGSQLEAVGAKAP